MVAGIFDGPVENNYKPIPEGIYNGYISKLEMRTSKAGNAYLNLEFSFPEINNRKQWDRLMWHNEACANVMKGKLESIGFTREERKQLDPDDAQCLISAVRAVSEGVQYEVKIGFDKDGNNVIKYFSNPNAVEEQDPLDMTTPAPAPAAQTFGSKKPRVQSPWPE